MQKALHQQMGLAPCKSEWGSMASRVTALLGSASGLLASITQMRLVAGSQGKVSAAFRGSSAPFRRPPRRLPFACHPVGELRHHQVPAVSDIYQPIHGVVRGWQVSVVFL